MALLVYFFSIVCYEIMDEGKGLSCCSCLAATHGGKFEIGGHPSDLSLPGKIRAMPKRSDENTFPAIPKISNIKIRKTRVSEGRYELHHHRHKSLFAGKTVYSLVEHTKPFL